MERPINKKIVLLSFLSVLLTFVYNNCGKMSVTQNKNKSLSSSSFEQLFGAQTDSLDMEHLSGSMGFDKAEITEGDTAKFSWVFNWGKVSSDGFVLTGFNCTNGLLPQNSSSDPEQLLKVTGGCDNLTGNCTWHANGDITLSGIKASDTPYSCQIQFVNPYSPNLSASNKTLSVSLKVKSANNSSLSPTPNNNSGGGTLSTLSFGDNPNNTGITGKATGFTENASWCLAYGTNATCTPNLSHMQDWTKTYKSPGVYDYTYRIEPYQKEFCPGDYTAVAQDSGGSPLTAKFLIGFPNFYAATGGLTVVNVPPPANGTLYGCFEYDQDHGPQNKPGSCGGQGTTPLIGNGWNYSSTNHSASFSGDSSVFGGNHGRIYFTYKYNCGPTQITSQPF